MTAERLTWDHVLIPAERMAEIRRLIATEPGTLTVLPADDPDALRTALAFYADPANWREGCGTGPGRPAPCVADGGAKAREALGGSEVRQASVGGEQ